ncbi:unnamed protein product [Ceutorhynchus assimilis]|uniref:Uncharacterized protein n=1 Tax=Ceutorhynchus assimilis TaxID=467358 RepID=A0A9N9MDE4_9CUCU|nr:unnamed protein product [Ceutorhynchus assimilis]
MKNKVQLDRNKFRDVIEEELRKRRSKLQSAEELQEECFNDATFMTSFANTIANLVTSKLTEQINALKDKISDLEIEKENLSKKVDELEQGSKINQLRLYGLPESSTEDLKTKVQQVIQTNVQVQDISMED